MLSLAKRKEKYLWFDSLYDCIESAAEAFRMHNWHWKGRVKPSKEMLKEMLEYLRKESLTFPSENMIHCGRLGYSDRKYGHEK